MEKNLSCIFCGKSVKRKNEEFFDQVICYECKNRRKKYWCENCKEIYSSNEISAPNIGNLTFDEIEKTDNNILLKRPKNYTISKLEDFSTWNRSKLLNDKFYSLIKMSENCPNCGKNLNIGWEYEKFNFARITYLIFMLLLGIIGAKFNFSFSQWIGFGIPFFYLFVGVLIVKNIRWIFMRWERNFMPIWKKDNFSSIYGNSFFFLFLKELLISIGIVVIGIIFLVTIQIAEKFWGNIFGM